MQLYRVVFAAKRQGEPGAEFLVSSPSEREAVAQATTLFSERYRERQLTDYEVQVAPTTQQKK